MDKIIYTEAQIESSINRQVSILEERHAQYDMGCLTIIGILNGSFLYMSEIVKRLRFKTTIDFMKVKSYKGQEKGETRFTLLPDIRKGGDLLILDDILDSGATIQAAIDYLQYSEPYSITMMTMLHKVGAPQAMESYLQKHFVFADLGLPVADWVYGFGLDNDEYDRNLKSIYKV